MQKCADCGWCACAATSQQPKTIDFNHIVSAITVSDNASLSFVNLVRPLLLARLFFEGTPLQALHGGACQQCMCLAKNSRQLMLACGYSSGECLSEVDYAGNSRFCLQAQSDPHQFSSVLHELAGTVAVYCLRAWLPCAPWGALTETW